MVAPRPPAPPRPVQVGINPINVVSTPKGTCHVFDGYVVFTKSWKDQVGDRIWVKRIPAGATRAPAVLCRHQGPPYIFKHTDRNAASYLAGLVKDRLLLDDGTGMARLLYVIDLRTGKRVFRLQYVGGISHLRGSVIQYDEELNGDADECVGKGCLAKRKAAFAALKKEYAPRFNHSRMPDCPSALNVGGRKGRFWPKEGFRGRRSLNVETLKRAPLPQVTRVFSGE